MPLILLIIIGCIGMMTLLATVIGITLSDIRSLRLNSDFRRHPHARRFRQRPLVSVVIDGEPTDDSLKSIRRSNYRKHEIITNEKVINGQLLLTITPDTILERTAISRAVRQFNNDSSMHMIEIMPVLQSPQTVRQFFHFYHKIASAPFITARAGLAVTLPRSSWPVLANLEMTAVTRRTRIYLIMRWLAGIANLYTLVYVGYIAVVLYQPEFFLMYLGTFGAWMLWAMSRYQQLRFRDKLFYLVLAPASLIYFALRSLFTPLRFPFSAIIST